MRKYCLLTKSHDGKFYNCLEVSPDLKSGGWMWFYFDENNEITAMFRKDKNPFLSSNQERIKKFVAYEFGSGWYRVHIPKGRFKGGTVVCQFYVNESEKGFDIKDEEEDDNDKDDEGGDQ